MKSKEEIERLATRHYRSNGSGGGQYTEGLQEGRLIGYVDGYTKCQEDMAKESIAFANFLKADFEMEDSGSSDDILWLLCGTRQTYTTDEIYDEFIKSRSFIKSLNKKDREEIQPNDIWNKESQDKIKEHILNLAKKQTPKDRLETELMAKKYTEEDMIKFAFDTYCYISGIMKVPFNQVSENRTHAEENLKVFINLLNKQD